MAEQVEPEGQPGQPLEVLPEKPTEALPERPAQASQERPAEVPSEAQAGKAAEVPAEKAPEGQAIKKNEDIPSAKMGSARQAKAQAKKTSSVKSATAPREKASRASGGPVQWRDVATILNFLLLIANWILLYPAWKGADAEAEQAEIARREAETAQQEAAKLRGELGDVKHQIELLRYPPPNPAPPHPDRGSMDLAVVPESFNCSVREQGDERTLLNADICYELRFDVENNGAVNRRVKARAMFSREDRFWTCSSEAKTVAFDRKEPISIPLISCFDREEERRTGNINFSLQIESLVE